MEKQRFWGFLAHTSIIIGMMLVIFFVIDRFNPAMEFLSSNISKWLILAFAVCSILNGLFSAVFLFQRLKRQEEKRSHPQTRTAYDHGQIPQQRLAPPEYYTRGHLPQQRQPNGYIPDQGYPVPQQRNVNGGLPKYSGEQSEPEHGYRGAYRR
jgi:uncharacterized integral membrane protein